MTPKKIKREKVQSSRKQNFKKQHRHTPMEVTRAPILTLKIIYLPFQ